MDEINMDDFDIEMDDYDIETIPIRDAIRLVAYSRWNAVKDQIETTIEDAIRGVEIELNGLPENQHRSYLVDCYDMQEALSSLDSKSTASDIWYAVHMVELVKKYSNPRSQA